MPDTKDNIPSEYVCQKNGCDLRGAEIPEKYREWHGGATHYSEMISVYDRALDRTVSYRCPKCGGSWARS